METPDGPVFESNAIARYGTSFFFLSIDFIKFWIQYLILLFSVTRLKADNPLYGSSLIEYVRTPFIIVNVCNKCCLVCCTKSSAAMLGHCYRPTLSNGWILLRLKLTQVLQGGIILGLDIGHLFNRSIQIVSNLFMFFIFCLYLPLTFCRLRNLQLLI